jgi:hypothetical protein
VNAYTHVHRYRRGGRGCVRKERRLLRLYPTSKERRNKQKKNELENQPCHLKKAEESIHSDPLLQRPHDGSTHCQAPLQIRGKNGSEGQHHAFIDSVKCRDWMRRPFPKLLLPFLPLQIKHASTIVISTVILFFICYLNCPLKTNEKENSKFVG